MADLITIKQVGELIGQKSQPAVHAWLKRFGVAKVRRLSEFNKEKRVYVNRGDVMVVLENKKTQVKQPKTAGAANDSNVKPAKVSKQVARPADDDLITIVEAMSLLGVKGQGSVHSFVKSHRIAKVLEGKRVYVSKAAILEAKDQPTPTSSGVQVKQDKPNPFKKFESNPKLIAWDKGSYRGWAVAAVSDVSSSTVTMLTDYGKSYMWPHVTMSKAIAEGKAFYMEPHEMLRFVSLQLLRVKSGHGELPSIVKELTELAERLKQVKVDLTKVSVDSVEAKSSPEDLDLDIEEEEVVDGTEES